MPGLPTGFPVPALVMLALVALGGFVLTRTRFGRHVYAVGGNEEASRLSGVSVGWVKLGGVRDRGRERGARRGPARRASSAAAGPTPACCTS